MQRASHLKNLKPSLRRELWLNSTEMQLRMIKKTMFAQSLENLLLDMVRSQNG